MELVLKPQLYAGATKPTPELFKPVRNDHYRVVKPNGGLWTSTYDEQLGSDWVQWCLREEFRRNPFRCWLLAPSPVARVYTINNLPALRELARRYPRSPGDLPIVSLDFEAIARDYDAIHLTANGEDETRFSTPDLYGWDCESTLWLHWAFKRVDARGWKEFGNQRKGTGTDG